MLPIFHHNSRLTKTIWKFLAFSLITLCAYCTTARVSHASRLDKQLKFRHITTQQGLSQNSVISIAQDKEGFMWFGTQSGLQKYDGYRFQNFQHNPQNSKTISSGIISTISFDNKGDVWTGIFPNTVDAFDRDHNEFTHYIIPNKDAEGFIQKILPVDNEIWVGSDGGVSIIDTSDKSIKNIDSLTGKNTFIVNLFKDSFNNIWVVSKTSLFYVDATNKNILSQFSPSLSKKDFIRTVTFKGNKLWFGTDKGEIWYFDTRKQEFSREVSLSQHLKNPTISIFSMTFFKNNVWVGSDNQGLINYDLTTHEVTNYKHQKDEKLSLSNNHIISLLMDQSGLLWIGTTSNGVDRTSLVQNEFLTFRESVNTSNSPFINDIRATMYSSQSEIWMAINNGSLKKFIADENRYITYKIPQHDDINSQGYGIADLIEDQEGNILYASRAGFWKFNTSTKIFKLIYLGENSEANAIVPLSFIKDNNKTIWVGSNNAGIGKYNNDNETIEWFSIPEVLKGQLSSFILSLQIADNNTLWIGTSYGLGLFNTRTHTYQSILLNPDNPGKNIIRTLYLAENGTLWVGTLSGIYSVSKANDRWVVDYPFPEITSLSSNIYAILADGNGKLWISTNSGITRVDIKSKKYRHFTSEQGLQGDEFNGNAAFKTPDGRFWFAGLNGLNAFFPESVVKSQFMPPVWITAYQIGTEYHTVNRPERLSRLELPYDSDFIKIEFSSLDYHNPEENNYRIRTSDLKNKWIDLQNSNEIIYSNLESDNLNIHIMGSNHDGVWNPNFSSLLITVLPPPWLTPQAYLFYFLILIIFGYLLIKLWQKRISEQQTFIRTLNESKQQLSWALWGSGDAFWVWDVESDSIFRQGLEGLLGYEEGEISGDPAGLKKLMHPDDVESSFQKAEQRIQTIDKGFLELEYRLKNKSNDWIWILDRGKIVETNDLGQTSKMAGTFRDISFQKKFETNQKLSDLIIRNMAEMVLIVDSNFRIQSANPSFCFSMGFQLHEIKDKDPSIFNSSKQLPEFYQNIRAHVLRFGHWQGEMYQTNRNKQDTLHWVELITIKNDDNVITNIIMVATDITDKKQAEEELRTLANYDTLTLLPNRALFHDRLEHALLQAERHLNKVALLFIDLDRFKHINDSLGHSLGDEVLKTVSTLISNSVRKDDTVCRLGGDEFTVILENISDGLSTFHVCEKIIEAFTNPLEIEQRQISITPSIGISIYPDDATDAANLIKFADTAMYVAKSQGRNQFKFYAQEMNRNALRRLELEHHLRHALENKEFYLVYQPIMNTQTEAINGVEVLLRWENNYIGHISPEEFIPLAEEIGLIISIGERVLDNACKQAKKWHDAGYNDLNIAVNLSPLQFKNYDLFGMISHVLQKYQYPGHLLTLEITESLLMDNIEVTRAQLIQLQQLNVKFAVDDFGTGYSALNYLKQFPLNSLKIDRTFITDITSAENDAPLTKAIIGLSHILGLSVTAEGVETKEQLEFLKQASCEEVQGYYLSRPLLAEDFELFLKNKSSN
ncbi:MAG TPA: EAL domain-containing protein [Aeromonadales bacterium]|nr:EAL domain-containing protein [Aeromonadales bacterium]